MKVGEDWVVANAGLTFLTRDGRLCYLHSTPKAGDRSYQVRTGFQARSLAASADTDEQEWYVSTKVVRIGLTQPDRLIAWVPPECVALVPKCIDVFVMRYAWSAQASEVVARAVLVLC